jgi:hypothetical protein
MYSGFTSSSLELTPIPETRWGLGLPTTLRPALDLNPWAEVSESWLQTSEIRLKFTIA